MTGSLMTADDVAIMIGMSSDWIYEQVRRDRIPHVRLGRYVRFRRESVDEWIVSLERGTVSVTTKSPGRRLEPPPGTATEVSAP